MANLSKAQELRRKNQETHAKMVALLKKADDEKRSPTPEEDSEWTKLREEYVLRKTEITRNETMEAQEAELGRLDSRRAGREPEGPSRPETLDNERKALRAFITQPATEWDPETRELIAAHQKDVPREARNMGHTFVLPGRRDLVLGEGAEKRALTAAANTTVAEDFMREMDVNLLAYSGIAQAARFVNTDTGADLPWPLMDDSTHKAHLLAELSAAAVNVDPALTNIVLGAFLYTSDCVLVPNQLMQDSAFSVESWLAQALGVRMGRGLNYDGTLGAGGAAPRGLITAILADTTELKAASATAIAFGDIVNLYHAVDPAYRQGPKVGFMMHDDVLKVVEKIVDSNGRPIFRPANEAVGSIDTLYNRPIYINQDMDSTVAEDKESIVFGDFSKFIVRRAMNPILVRLNELYALYFQTGFVMFERWDTDLVSASTKALRLLSHNLA
jgi:HK97 family phage major capsid protein